ncbi:MAG: hypothetical protein GXP62_05225, partial [Oligoflexia bacterium]|nr:hypothetical protein [Oligoflexia bacterium]
RPVAVLFHQLDFALWRDQAWLQHAHSLAWWGLGAWLIGRLYRQVLPGALAAAGLAALLFALADDHAMVIGWLAGRNGLLALVFGTLCLSLHIGGHRVAALFVAVLGLGVGEPFVGALAYVAAWELTRADPLRVKLARLLPYAVLLSGWRLWYQAEGYGAANSGLYVDPGRQPLRFLLALAERGPWMAAGQTLGLPVDLWLFLTRPVQLLVAGAALLSVGGLCWLLAPLFRGSRPAAFLALGSLLALIPPCGAFPTARLMLWSGVGFFGLLGLAAQQLGMLAVSAAGGGDGHQRGEPMGRAGWRRRAVMALLGIHLVLSGLMLPWRLLLWPVLGSTFHAGALQAPHDAKLAEQTLVFVNGSELMVSYTGVIRAVIEHSSGGEGATPRWGQRLGGWRSCPR